MKERMYAIEYLKDPLYQKEKTFSENVMTICNREFMSGAKYHSMIRNPQNSNEIVLLFITS